MSDIMEFREVDCGYGRKITIKQGDNFYCITLDINFRRFKNQSNILASEYSEGNKYVSCEKIEEEIEKMKNLSGHLHRVWESY